MIVKLRASSGATRRLKAVQQEDQWPGPGRAYEDVGLVRLISAVSKSSIIQTSLLHQGMRSPLRNFRTRRPLAQGAELGAF